ncbi:MAG: hypothetical protein Q7R39_11380 [Dehalococcoidia bacterium]|nr:hypothetical protein [Dehalococcoidia bacterium]
MAVVIVGVGLLGYGSLQVFSYLQNDPNFCRSCHTMEVAWQRWSTSEHRSINCHSCHEQSPIESMNLVVEYALNNPTRVVKHAGISDESCLNCHGSGNSRWFQIANTAGHRVHFEGQGISCVKCHSVSIHRFSPSTEVCKVCHTEEKIKVTAMAERYCLDCHQFLREDSPLRPTRQTCLECHLNQVQTKVTWPAGAPMQFECSQCHKPHVAEAPVVNCISCHQDIPKQGLHAKTTHSQSTCQACHQPHEWKVEKREACLTCHANKSTHNSGVFCGNCHDFRNGGAGKSI